MSAATRLTDKTTTARRAPLRTCISCRLQGSKRDFIRIVRTPEGAVRPDPGGKANGRGAYLGPVQRCWREALDEQRLNHALRTTLSEADRQQIESFIADLPQDACPNQTSRPGNEAP